MSFILVTASITLAQESQPASAPSRPDYRGRWPFVQAPKLSPPAKLAGDLSDPAWSKAAVLPMNDAFTGMGVKLQTVGYVFCTDDAMYFGLRCQEPQMDKLILKGDLWARDSVEIFIEPQADLHGRPYNQITLDAQGNAEFARLHYYPYPKYFNQKSGEEKWEPKVDSAVAKGPDGWTVELRLPYSSMKIKEDVSPAKGCWRLNVYRNRPARDRQAAMNWSWAPTGMKSYHMAGRFGLLVPQTFADPALIKTLETLPASAWAKPADEAFLAKMDAAFKKITGDDAAQRDQAADELIALAQTSISGPMLISQRATAQFRPLYAAREKMPSMRRVLDYCNLAALVEDDDEPPMAIRRMVDDFAALNYTDQAGKTLPYRLLKPPALTRPARSSFAGNQPAGSQPATTQADDKTRYPLVLFLHGSGETGSDNRRPLADGSLYFNRPENRQKYPCFVLAPQCPLGESWTNQTTPGSGEQLRNKHYYTFANQPSEPMRLTLELIDSLLKQYPQIDPGRIYVSGASMGGYGTYEAVMLRPTLFAAAAPIAGGGDADQAKNIASTPFHLFHGELDTSVSPECAKVMYQALKAAGDKVEMTLYPDQGHVIIPIDGPVYLEWMFAQRREK